jgi:hypothetical protein
MGMQYFSNLLMQGIAGIKKWGGGNFIICIIMKSLVPYFNLNSFMNLF